MDTLLAIAATISLVSLVAWAWLVFARGGFWRTDQRLSCRDIGPGKDGPWPAVDVILPARNEADTLPLTLPALLAQDYPGDLTVYLVDDGSDDGTAGAARRIAAETGATGRLVVVEAEPLPEGWAGKVWALDRGVAAAAGSLAEYLLLTDADIGHPPGSLRTLVHKATSRRLDLVSVMARLNVRTLWDRFLVPAFVFFFAKLYPFGWANDPMRRTAAAAGGCILLRKTALERIGGFESIAGELIDDCALARRIKRPGRSARGRIWLGLARQVRSVRRYETPGPIWDTVARTAYVQLRFSPVLLAATVAGMLALYLAPPLTALGGLAWAASGGTATALLIAASGGLAWVLMSACYLPILRWHGVSPVFAPLLPAVAVLYTAMTVDSALRWRRGQGGGWKGRRYGDSVSAPSVRR